MANWDVLVLLGYDPAIVPERVQMTTGSGVEFVPRINVERVEALGQERRNFPLLCHLALWWTGFLVWTSSEGNDWWWILAPEW